MDAHRATLASQLDRSTSGPSVLLRAASHYKNFTSVTLHHLSTMMVIIIQTVQLKNLSFFSRMLT